MITRGTIFLLSVLVLLFGASVWAGFWYRSMNAVERQYAQPGWCCMLRQRECVVADSFDACRGQGGASFDWNRDACDTICHPPVRRVQQKKPVPAP